MLVILRSLYFSPLSHFSGSVMYKAVQVSDSFYTMQHKFYAHCLFVQKHHVCLCRHFFWVRQAIYIDHQTFEELREDNVVVYSKHTHLRYPRIVVHMHWCANFQKGRGFNLSSSYKSDHHQCFAYICTFAWMCFWLMHANVGS